MLLALRLLAAPVPAPSGILDVGPPPKGWTAEQYINEQIKFKSSPQILNKVCSDPEVKKLPLVATVKDARPWMEQNVCVTPEEGRRRLRITFRAGKRPEQVAIINAFLRVNLSEIKDTIKSDEADLHRCENLISKLESRDTTQSFREFIHGLRSNRIPQLRAEIARLKQYTVIKWAK